MPQFQIGSYLIASVIIGALSTWALLATLGGNTTHMSITPSLEQVVLHDTLVVHVTVNSAIPVNVFRGILHFDPNHLQIAHIDYNTSIADLWAEEPWYSNGDGTVTFAGGTTHAGGFIGEGSLITITFTSIASGETSVRLSDVRILQHDGFGTDSEVEVPIDALFTVASTTLNAETVTSATPADQNITILTKKNVTDLNGDGVQTLVDISIFMHDLAVQNKRSDFSGDGIVSTKDLSIILRQ